MKHVTFNLTFNQTYETYSSSEYDRIPIFSQLYCKRRTNQMSDEEWNLELEKINLFKTQEMIVHKKSISNTRLHV